MKSSRYYVSEANDSTGKDVRTALICVSANGLALNPLFLYAGKHLMDSWCTYGPSGARYAVTAKVSFVVTIHDLRENISNNE